MLRSKYLSFAVLVALAAPLSAGAASLKEMPALASSAADHAAMLGATWAGKRAIAVGDHGVVLLSDDNGAHFKQAKSVPVSVPLTSVSFANDKQGWAVGHWGTILATSDGGDSWTTQRLVETEDRPLFAVHFFDDKHGVAVGLWSLVLTTDDGGKSWNTQEVPKQPSGARGDLNLMNIFASPNGVVYATAERGQLLSSSDMGHTWSYLDTGYAGTLWCGAVLADGSLLVGGQRGTLLHGDAAGAQWETVDLSSQSSVTGIAVADKDVVVVGLDGLTAVSSDFGKSFTPKQTPENGSLTAVLKAKNEKSILFSRRGVIY